MKDDDRDRFIMEDVGYGDITTDLLSSDDFAGAEIIANQDCVVAGIEEATSIFEHFGLSAEPVVEDGSEVSKGTHLIRLKGSRKNILTAERLALNLIMHMSGIATKTSRLTHLARKKNPDVKIAATRKTVPGFRFYQKKAVELGGGDTHRFRLDDLFLIKDNHLASGMSIKEAIENAKDKHFTKKVEVECESLDQAMEAVSSGADIVMLDNFCPDLAREGYEKIKKSNPEVLVEISGGITEENIMDYAESADIISMGALTHSYISIDVSLNMVN